MFRTFIAAMLLSSFAFAGTVLSEESTLYKQRYNLKDPYTKLVNNEGKGYSNLWGARNVRQVLAGVLYRGGANNKHFSPPRSNMNPLPTEGLKNLCEEGFSSAVYLYSENFSKAPRTVACLDLSLKDRTFSYKQMSPYSQTQGILDLIYKRIKGQITGPIYTHCWNGWHASGAISAIALKQFCGFTAAQADKYWVKNTDGNSTGHESIRTRIKNFKPLVQYQISEDEQRLICPEP